MTTELTINVTNRSPVTQDFHVFQQPSLFSGDGVIYSNSLLWERLGSHDQTGAILTFQVSRQAFAAIQQAFGRPQVGQTSGFSAAFRPIDLTRPGSPPNATLASVRPLALAQPAPAPGVQPGAFRITTPVYSPTETYNIGSAVAVNGGVVLSSFVVGRPAYSTDIQPIPKFYVQTGSQARGSVVNFMQASVQAALCDFTGGPTAIDVVLNADGTWSVRTVR